MKLERIKRVLSGATMGYLLDRPQTLTQIGFFCPNNQAINQCVSITYCAVSNSVFQLLIARSAVKINQSTNQSSVFQLLIARSQISGMI